MARRRRGERDLTPAPNVSWNEDRGVYVLNVRDGRLTGGRVSMSLGTDDPDKARLRRQHFFTMLDAGRYGAINSLRQGKVQWSDVERAVRTGDWDSLRRASAVGESVEESVRVWLKEVKRRTQRDGTIDKYEGIVDDLAAFVAAPPAPLEPARTMGEVTSDHIRAWLAAPRKRTGRPWSPNAQTLSRSTAKQLFDFAMQREAEKAARGEVPSIALNPVDAVARVETEKTRFEFLRPEEWTEIERKATGLPELAPLAIGCLAGLRVGEVQHLRLGIDVDLEGNRLRVQPRAGRYPWKPKTNNSIRDVPMSPRLRSIVDAHIASRYAGETYLVIAAKRDRPVSKKRMQALTKEIFTAAGIQYGQKKDALTFHSLRHTFASWLVQRDVQLMKVAKLLGDTVEEVAKTYAHLMPSDLERAVGVIDETLNGTNGSTNDSRAD